MQTGGGGRVLRRERVPFVSLGKRGGARGDTVRVSRFLRMSTTANHRGVGSELAM